MEKKATSKRYPPELKERAVRDGPRAPAAGSRRPDGDLEGGPPARHGRRVTAGLGQAGRGRRRRREPGLTTEEQAELKQLRKENFELRRANDILQAAATFFGAELDRRQKK